MNRLIKKQKSPTNSIFNQQSQKIKLLLKQNDSISSNFHNIHREKQITQLSNQIKIEILTRKLHNNHQINHKLKQTTQNHQNLNKQSFITQKNINLFEQNNNSTLFKNKTHQIKAVKDRFCLQSQSEFRKLQSNYDQLIKRFEQSKSYNNINKQKNKDSQLILQKSLQEIKRKVSNMDYQRIQVNFYPNSFKKSLNLKNYVLKYSGLLKESYNLSPTLQDGSLLLSFKKNLDQEDSFSVLKYSQDSVKNTKDRKYLKDTSIYRQTFESFSKDKVPNLAHKLSYKDKVIESEGSEAYHTDYFEIAKDNIQKFLSLQKGNIGFIKSEAMKGEQKCEKLLDKMLYEIALEKIQRQQQYKQIMILLDQQFQNVCTIMEEMERIKTLGDLKFQEKVYEAKQNIQLKTMIQHNTRKQDQSLIIKMLFEVVQLLQ